MSKEFLKFNQGISGKNIVSTSTNYEKGIKNNRIYPPSQNYTLTKDYYFMMSDNRDYSLDSRFWCFVPRENIVGTPIILFWSWDSDIPFSTSLELLSSIRFDRIVKLVKQK